MHRRTKKHVTGFCAAEPHRVEIRALATMMPETKTNNSSQPFIRRPKTDSESFNPAIARSGRSRSDPRLRSAPLTLRKESPRDTRRARTRIRREGQTANFQCDVVVGMQCSWRSEKSGGGRHVNKHRLFFLAHASKWWGQMSRAPTEQSRFSSWERKSQGWTIRQLVLG